MADEKPQELDPALVERTGLAAIDHMLDRRGLRQTLESIRAEDEDLWKEIVEATGVAALLSLGIPAAALNAIARGEAVVALPGTMPPAQVRDTWMWQRGDTIKSEMWVNEGDLVSIRALAASPYRSEP